MPAEQREPDVDGLIHLFNNLFQDSYQTILVRGQGEPIYLPRCETHCHHRIVFAHGYFASALHEIAHWTVAGKARRQLEDFGYWYKPDGRTAQEQRQFECVEVKPQALEWIYSVASGQSFHFSADNLDGHVGDMEPFKERVWEQVMAWLGQGLPNRRARMWVAALLAHYQTPALRPEHFPHPSDCRAQVVP